jgi:beta-glucosidase
VPAVCYPTASAIACSFDRDLLWEVGKAIGEECRQEDVAVVLGPGVNMKRSSLCGRNFEYYSEDPLLAGELAAAFINGVQSQDVGTSLKHYAANNQETRRLVSESVMDERTFREIYLTAFEIAVKKAQPWTMMASYNRLFGEYASQNRRLLTDILRDEWGFDGVVVSDWGACVDRVEALKAGLDLEMPHIDDINDNRIIQAVKDGRLPMDVLDSAAERLVELILRSRQRKSFRFNLKSHRSLARRAAAESAVLLKNEGGILPGNPKQRAAVIGAFARHPRYQGSGSSKVNPVKLDDACDELARLGLKFDYSEGYRMDSDQPDARLTEEACTISRGKDVVFLFTGLPDSYEAEGFDRDSMKMPECHVDLIRAVSKVNEHVVVVLQGGSPMEMTWADEVQGILLVSLGGEATGGACADLLMGKASPGGRLAESWPFSAADNPSHAFFPGYPRTVEYREGPFIGYRYYDKARRAVQYPFGYGLAYTQFEYGGLKLSARKIKDSDTLTVTCRIKNTGKKTASEVVQLYVACRDSVIIRPEQELMGFEKVKLKPGESRTVRFNLDKRAFAYFNTTISDWHVESGDYEMRVGASSRDIRLKDVVHVESTHKAPLPDLRQEAPCYYDLSSGMLVSDREFEKLLGKPLPPRRRNWGTSQTIQSTLTEVRGNLVGWILVKILNKQMNKLAKDNPEIRVMAEKMIPDLPLRFLSMMSGGQFPLTRVEALVELMNGHLIRGLKGMRGK